MVVVKICWSTPIRESSILVAAVLWWSTGIDAASGRTSSWVSLVSSLAFTCYSSFNTITENLRNYVTKLMIANVFFIHIPWPRFDRWAAVTLRRINIIRRKWVLLDMLTAACGVHHPMVPLLATIQITIAQVFSINHVLNFSSMLEQQSVAQCTDQFTISMVVYSCRSDIWSSNVVFSSLITSIPFVLL